MQLRSSLHPGLFAAVYRIAANLAGLCGLTLPARAELLLAMPKVTQALFAALLDCYTWKLAEKAYGPGSRTALATVGIRLQFPMSISNIWDASFSLPCRYAARGSGSAPPVPCPIALRRQSQPLLSTIGLGTGQVLKEVARLGSRSTPRLQTKTSARFQSKLCNCRGKSTLYRRRCRLISCRLRVSLLLAALACVLRPTNALIWLSVSVPTLWQAPSRLRYVLVREVLFCG
jgi:phosphatidylinositol glycan class B